MVNKNNYFLVIGANGLIGRAIARKIDKKHKWIGACHKRPEKGLLQLDITSDTELTKIVNKTKPGFIINCANLAGGVNFCENNPGLAKRFHLESTKTIGLLCKEIDAALVFISTDYIFDGKKETPYNEDDKPNPLNMYGELKLEAEHWIQTNLDKFIIIRTTNVYGWDPETVTPNYVMGLYRALREKKTFEGPVFLWGNPTYADDLAQAIIELSEKKAHGVFHVVGPDYINRFGWAKEACRVLSLDSSLVRKIETPAPGLISRPLKSCLSAERFKSSFKTVLHNVTGGLTLMKDAMGS